MGVSRNGTTPDFTEEATARQWVGHFSFPSMKLMNYQNTYTMKIKRYIGYAAIIVVADQLGIPVCYLNIAKTAIETGIIPEAIFITVIEKEALRMVNEINALGLKENAEQMAIDLLENLKFEK